ncbi:hypothetical protein LB523_17260 [Mesorhizobium sp. ESP-6-4]|uniref:hypothetical protein n=1 Tax=unclassified Mesorhizobium TaxID=325217 RepID=UPI001CCC5C69|nr:MULTISPECIES: hypothetical protein [unclassified Mesorhizobium]MBZ9660802.1 hypothetical protein [Mesorhizobium sp. ESP-6-4]MBZ9768318.1 hypothetical protein [Mesorhizobium sp. CA6]
MDVQADPRRASTAKELVHAALLSAPFGETVSIKETIAAVRRVGAGLRESDCQLTEFIMYEAILLGRFIAFDLHE